MPAKANGEKDRGVLLIGGLKLLKALLLFAVAFGALKLIGKNPAQELAHLIEQLNADPHSRYFEGLLTKVSGWDSKKVELLGIGTFFYAALFATEGMGLLLCRRWAEYLTVIITTSFLPLEIYEVIKKFNALKIIVILLNVGIVLYLIYRLKHRFRRT